MTISVLWFKFHRILFVCKGANWYAIIGVKPEYEPVTARLCRRWLLLRFAMSHVPKISINIQIVYFRKRTWEHHKYFFYVSIS